MNWVDSTSAAPKRRRSLVGGDDGVAVIEFAIVAPVLVILLLGVVQLGLLLTQQQSLHAAAREGARQASFPGSTRSEIEDAVAEAYSVGFGPTPVITISPDDNQPCLDRRGEDVEVELLMTTTLDIPFAAGQTVQMQSSGTFRCE